MKKSLRKFTFLLSLIVVTFTSCEKDSNEGSDSDLIGTWTIDNQIIDLKVGNESALSLLILALQITEAEAQAMIDEFLDGYLDDLEGGTINFLANHNYLVTFPGETDDGTWSLSSDKKSLLLDEGTIDETTFEVLTLNANSLVVTLPEETEMVDIDEDGVDEEVRLLVELHLSK